MTTTAIGLVGHGRINTAVAQLIDRDSRARVCGVATRSGTGIAETFADQRPDIVVIATMSKVADVTDAIVDAASVTRRIVCTSEELAFSAVEDLPPEIRRLVEDGLVLVTVGLNPGWVFDSAPLAMSAPLRGVEQVKSWRMVDISGFGPTVLRNLGIGFDPVEFDELVATGGIRGHLGFERSAIHLGRQFGWRIDQVEKSIEPIVASTVATANGVHIAPGLTAGIRQAATATEGGRVRVEYDFSAHIDPAGAGLTTSDRTRIDAASGVVDFTITPGLTPVPSTAALIVNSIPGVLRLEPGVHGTSDIPGLHAR